ncbi:tetratricopeptide repeat protein [Myxococcus sp. K38C18041901]|uniref:tetratricopeptide repeat protein n=1 Tax=Myxococcus guangdongensis TaxID=2906760 RepID=UPI0020A77B04|nr:tetratricopeptide repeat protein [Myxococcus guangdongensis]MCP3064549.1 tetratricopeptide repeat protein [Myxococcus guangdongensis]
MTTRVKGRPETSPADDEFLQQLQRGGELLAANKVIEARSFLERAHQLQPRNEKAQNLLGLCFFKLGMFDRAAELYEMLVRDNPVDPTLRVNLGLVYLKTNALQRAVREFETATDLSPEHQKAQNYLGLALAQMGEYGRAREHFLLAGSDAMAEKMSRAIAGENFARATPAPVPPPAARVESPAPVRAQPPEPEEEEIRFAEDEGPSALGDGESESAASEAQAREETGRAGASGSSSTGRAPGASGAFATGGGQGVSGSSVAGGSQGASLTSAATGALGVSATGAVGAPGVASMAGSVTTVGASGATGAHAESPQAGSGTSPAPVSSAPAGTVPAGDESSAATSSVPLSRLQLTKVAARPSPARETAASAPLLTVLAPSLALDSERGSGPFALGEGRFRIAVDTELLTRLDGLVALEGQLAFQPEMKRFRGRATDKPFGEGASRMVRARGRGLLHLEPSERRTFLAVDLGEDSAYFRDENVFAFEEPVMFENGRVPSDIAPDLDLVHLRGQGQVLLSLPGPLRSVAVRPEAPVTVPLTHLVGWQGNLTPRVVPLLKSTSGESLRTAVELGGEGFALIALGVR